jgi:short-subunit dehydrogenase
MGQHKEHSLKSVLDSFNLAGRTALITGSSSGIGLALSRGLAGAGATVILNARNEDKLQQAAARLREEGAAVHAVAFDVTSGPAVAEAIDRIERDIGPIDILVNNAGMGTYGPFAQLDIAREEQEIRLNVLALVRLTHAALGPMTARGRGAILNISSLAAYQPAPSSATYGATKAFVNSFTHAVHEEARAAGVHVMVVCPGYTHTEFHERAGLGRTSLPEFIWHSPDEVVAVALHDLDRRRSVSIPGALNKTLGALSSTAPAGISRRIAGMIVRRSG